MNPDVSLTTIAKSLCAIIVCRCNALVHRNTVVWHRQGHAWRSPFWKGMPEKLNVEQVFAVEGLESFSVGWHCSLLEFFQW